MNLIQSTLAEEEVLIPNIIIKDASLAYDKTPLFSQLNLHLPAGKWVALLGASGIGKSSLLRMLANLITSEEKIQGSISTDNHIPIHHQIAYMAQTDLLLPWLTVLENVTLRLKLRRHNRADSAIYLEQAKTLLKKVGLEKAMYFYPKQLSGGMRQRAALVRTLIENKPIVLMDEPFSAVDAMTRHKLQALAADLLQDKTVIFVTHDPAEALRLAHIVYIMQGRPAVLKTFAHLTSSLPREPTHPEVMNLHALLYHELSQAGNL